MIVVGIDPDLEASGIAIVEDRQLSAMSMMTFMELHSFIYAAAQNRSKYIFVVEDVEKNRALYAKHGGQSAVVREKIAQNVGQVKAVARLIQQMLTFFDMKYYMAPPIRGQMKRAKTDRDYFNKLTGWTGSSNADKRDAAMIALFGIPYIKLINNAK